MASAPTLSLRSTGQLRPEQRLSLRAGLRQGMALLSLPAVDLNAELARQAADNPFLLVELRRSDISPDAVSHIAAVPSLSDHLRTQISCMDLTPRIRALALYFAADLDPRGYLPGTDSEIAAELGVPADEVTQARAALHLCDPTGVGAEDAGECVALQLIERGVPPTLAHDVILHLAALADGRVGAAARALGLTPEAARSLADTIRRCTLDPAAQFDTSEVRPLTPEIEVEKTRLGGIVVRLIDDPARAVTLDAGLIARAGQARDTGAAAFARDRQSAARRLVASLAFRSRTLLGVAEALAEAQSAYFLGHLRAPVPLRRSELAERLGLHPSTVGRAVKGRGLLFAGQVQPMGWYFPTGLPNGGNTLSQPEILARLRDLIAAETSETVLSDEAIADRLREDGVDIARRTVAKYRQCLHIPSSSRRRRQLVQRARDGSLTGGTT